MLYTIPCIDLPCPGVADSHVNIVLDDLSVGSQQFMCLLPLTLLHAAQ